MKAVDRRDATPASHSIPADNESGVRLRSESERYQVEYAYIVEGATVLDFERDSSSDDLAICRARVEELRRHHGARAIAVVIWDTATDGEVAADEATGP
jgi:hypothetical protein